MVAVCGGGTSGVRPGFEDRQTLTSAAISVALTAAGLPELAAVLAGVIRVSNFFLPTFCSGDPPADPGLTADDVANALNFQDIAVSAPAVQKVTQWFLSHYWYTACQCTSVATPAPPPLSAPTGYGKDGGLTTAQNVRCYETTAPYSNTGRASGRAPLDLTSIWVPATTDTKNVTINFPGGAVPSVARRIPAGVTAINFTTKNSGVASPSGVNATDVSALFWDASGNHVDSQQFLTTQNVQIGPITGNISLGPSSLYLSLAGEQTFNAQVANQVSSWDVDLWFVCGGSGLQQPCCPPDPIVNTKLDQLFGMVEQLLSLQGLAGPYQETVHHNNLSGEGVVTINPASSAIRVDVTSDLSNWPRHPQTPNYYLSLGFITPFAVGTPLRGQRLIYNKQIFQWPSYTDQIAYTFEPGVVANLVELTQGA